MFPRLILAAVFAFLAGQATAATLQVATGGSNAGNCVASSCQDLPYAVTQAAAGDTILFHSGAYTLSSGWSVGSKNGTSGNPITIKPYGDGDVTWSCASASTATECLTFNQVQYWTLDGQNGTSQLHISANSTNAGNGVYAFKTTNLIVRNVDIHDFRKACVFISGTTGLAYGSEDNVGTRVEANTLYNCALLNSARTAGSWPASLYFEGSRNAFARWNYIHNTYGEGIIWNQSSDNTSTGNYIVDVYSVCLYIGEGRNNTHEGNYCLLRDSNYKVLPGTKNVYSDGMSISNETSANTVLNPTFRNNTIDGANTGFRFFDSGFNAPLDGLKLLNNTIIAAETYGIQFNPVGSGTFSNNVVRCNLIGSVGTAPYQHDVAPTVTFDHNAWPSAPSSPASGTGDVVGAFKAPSIHSISNRVVGAYAAAIDANSRLANGCPNVDGVAFDYSRAPRTRPTSIGALNAQFGNSEDRGGL